MLHPRFNAQHDVINLVQMITVDGKAGAVILDSK